MKIAALPQSSVAVAKEPFSHELFNEIYPLSQKCWDECTQIKGATCAYFGERAFAIDPDPHAYARVNAVIVTLRDGGALVGYVEGFLYRSMHHKKILCGFGDSIFVEPEYRAYSPVIAERFEEEMRGMGAEIIGWPTHMNGPVYQLLKARGYVGDDVVMEKRLCASRLDS